LRKLENGGFLQVHEIGENNRGNMFPYACTEFTILSTNPEIISMLLGFAKELRDLHSRERHL
jgi:hypothetical protein